MQLDGHDLALKDTLHCLLDLMEIRYEVTDHSCSSVHQGASQHCLNKDSITCGSPQVRPGGIRVEANHHGDCDIESFAILV